MAKSNDCPAVLLIVFNRPDTTRKVFDRIKSATPKKLYVAADGPRVGNLQDHKACRCTREIIKNIDWSCDVNLLFQEKNLGCARNVYAAITWFFEHEEEGIILEDDCLPESEFFSYCKEMLEYHRFNDEIGVVCGDNHGLFEENENSYSLTSLPLIWGWATWKRSWRGFDLDFPAKEKMKVRSVIAEIFTRKKDQKYWLKILDESICKKIDSWAYPFSLFQMAAGRLHAWPKNCLVRNIGFDERATHTHSKANALSYESLGNSTLLSHSEIKRSSILLEKYMDDFVHPKGLARLKTFVYPYVPKKMREFIQKYI